ncbi:ribosomal protein L53 [Mactra antiquata]
MTLTEREMPVRFKPKYMSDAVKLGMLLKDYHIRPVSKMRYSFDPYCDNTASIRKVLSALHTKKVLKSSSAQTKIDVRSDRSKPQLDVVFSDGHQLTFKTEHLKASEIMETMKKFIDQRDTGPADEDISLTKMTGKMKKK